MKTTSFESVQDAFESVVAAYPEKTAATCSDQSISYRQLSEQSSALAARLINEGVQAGDLVGLCCERRIEMVVAILAILKAGAAYVPFDSAYPDSRLLAMAKDAGIKVLIGDMPVFDTLNLKRIPFGSFPDEPAEFTAPQLNPDALAYVMFTSGSTGTPKGVAVPHRGILRLVLQPDYCELGTDEKVLQHSPVAFDASTFEIWGALLNGGELVIMSPGELSLRALGDVIKDAGITTLWLTAGLFNAMVEERPADFAGVRQLLTGGDIVSPKHAKTILERHPNLKLINGYGPTENTTFTCCHTISLADVSEGQPIPIGKAISGTEVFVVDSELNPVPEGERGELVCAGKGVSLGYWENEALTSEVFVTAPWDPEVRLYRTGDSVARRSDGVVDFFGRIDQQVKIRGFRIELGEIETRILEVDGVQQVSVVAEAVGEGADKVLIAHFVSDAEIAKASFRNYLSEQLPDHSIPGFFARTKEIPLTPNGKVDRKRLPSLENLLTGNQLANGAVNGSSNGATNGAANGSSNGSMNGSANGHAAAAKSNGDTAQQIVLAAGHVLGLKTVPKNTNFFDLGASSIQIARIHERVQSAIGISFPITDFFQFPKAELLARHLDGEEQTESHNGSKRPARFDITEPIAVIGFAGRFPGADSVEQLWEMICEGREGLRDLSDEELIEKGVPAWKLKSKEYVKRGADIHAADEFDADLFGISHREAEITDPQGRVFMEVCHDALLHAGYPAEKHDGRIGLFGGAGIRSYSWRKVNYSDLSIDRLTEMVGNEKDFLTTRISYRLGLTGVSVPVQTACSSSLVAIHMARQSLLCGDSDITIAGGVSLNFPHGTGYMAAEGTMFTPNGRCRVFDQDADGTVFSPGAGAVVLKRLSDAQADGDFIHAVLMGSGVNNDGDRKIGFTAPSIQGQSGAIADALGDFDAKDIRYVEAHGTATKLGDPIEMTGLQTVYDSDGKSPECLVGSIKSNLGHTDAAAGVTGFIKAMLVAKHGVVPPTVNHDKPTDAFDFSASRFRVNTELETLPNEGTDLPLIGVSSFGVGGTNAHVILSPPPKTSSDPIEAVKEIPQRPIVLPISAASKKSLGLQINDLENLIEEQQPTSHDLAYSLCHTRPDLNWRAPALLIPDSDGTYQLHFQSESNWTKKKEHQATAFLFTGQGAQYPGMAKGLYQNETVFAETMDEICKVADPILGISLKDAIFDGSAEKLGETWLTQPALFAVEVANAKLWLSRGIVPTALLGHSIGEYAAAVIGKVFTLEDATRAVIERGRLMWSMPRGKMAVFPLPADEVAEIIKDEPELELATLNCPELNVIAGPEDVLTRVIEEQESLGVTGRLLHTSHAFHTKMMDEALAPFQAFIESLAPRSAPEIPIYSNVTGEQLTAAEATSAEYWARHIRQPVRFEQCIRKALDESVTHFVEVGPGKTLSTFVRKSLTPTDSAVAVETIRHPKEEACDHQTFLSSFGKYWACGGVVDWTPTIGSHGKKIELPRYPYDRKRFWRPLDSETSSDVSIKNPDLGQWFYRPKWESLPASHTNHQGQERIGGELLVISAGNLSEKFRAAVGQEFDGITHIKIGEQFSPLQNGKAVARTSFQQDFISIFAAMERSPSRIIITPTIGSSKRSGLNLVHFSRTAATESALHIVQAAHSEWSGVGLDLTLVSSGSCEVIGSDLNNPADATLRGFARVIAVEFPQHNTRWVDTDQNLDSLPWRFHDTGAPEFAVRNGKLWQANWAQEVLEPPATDPFQDGQTFVITGGTGGVGLETARRLGTQYKVNIVLCSRTELPDRNSEEAKSERNQNLFAAISEMEAAGSRVVVIKTDVSRTAMVASLKQSVSEMFGKVDGVFHAAGVLFDRPILLKERVTLNQVLLPKVEGSWILADAFSDSDFLFLFSSISSATPPAGQCDYSAGNNFMDALANQSASKKTGVRIISANWGSWREVGMAARHRDKPGAEFLLEEYENGIDPEEGFECIKRMIASGESQLAVYSRDFVSLYQSHAASEPNGEDFEQLSLEDNDSGGEPPANDLEMQILGLFVRALKRRDIGVLDCFFELGGDSLMAVGLLTRIRREIGGTLPNSVLIRAPNVRALANEIEKQSGSSSSETKPGTSADAGVSSNGSTEPLANYVIPFATEGSGVPVFGIHGAGGSVLFYRKTAQELAGLHPFYAIEDPLVNNPPESYLFENPTDKARMYLDEILKISTDGPLVLVGYSFGTKLSTEIGKLFKQKFPERSVIIVNIDQPASLQGGRNLGLRERIHSAWNHHQYDTKPRRAFCVAWRFYDAFAWKLYKRRKFKRAHRLMLKTGQMHENESIRNLQVEHQNNIMDAKYDAQSVDAHMVLLKAADQGDKFEYATDLGWSDLVTSLSIMSIPGDHISAVSEENQAFTASQIATAIKQSLTQHDAIGNDAAREPS